MRVLEGLEGLKGLERGAGAERGEANTVSRAP